MKLIFTKDDDKNIMIQIVTGTTTIDFSYVEMIKGLLKHNEFEEPVFEGDISEEEKERLKLLLEKINSAIAEDQQEESE